MFAVVNGAPARQDTSLTARFEAGLFGGLMVSLIVSIFVAACSSSSPRTLYWSALDSLDAVITRTGVTLDRTAANDTKGTIRVDVNGPTTIRLAEVSLDRPRTVLVYRGHLRAAKLRGHAYLEMRCGTDGQDDVATHATPVSGTTDWVSQVTKFEAEPGSGVRIVKLNLVADGTGVVWVRTIALFGQISR